MTLEIYGESDFRLEKRIALKLRYDSKGIELVMVNPTTDEQLEGGILLRVEEVDGKVQLKTIPYVNETHVRTVSTKNGYNRMASVVEAE